MSTFNIPSIDPSTLAGSLFNSGIGMTISPNGSGSTITTDDPNTLSSLLNSSGIGFSSQDAAGSSSDPFLSALEGQSATTPSATTFGGSPQQTDSLTGTSAASSFFAQYGVDAISIVVGLIIIVAAVVKIV